MRLDKIELLKGFKKYKSFYVQCKEFVFVMPLFLKECIHSFSGKPGSMTIIQRRTKWVVARFAPFCRNFLLMNQEDDAISSYLLLKQKIAERLLCSAVETGSFAMFETLLKEETHLSKNPLRKAAVSHHLVLEACCLPAAEDKRILMGLLQLGMKPQSLQFPEKVPASCLKLLIRAGYFLDVELLLHTKRPLYQSKVSSLQDQSTFAVRKAIACAGSNVLASAKLLGLPLRLQTIVERPCGEDSKALFFALLFFEKRYHCLERNYLNWLKNQECIVVD